MPGDGGYWYNQQNKALMEDPQAAAAAAKKAADAQAAAASVLTPEQRQANIARDLALSQTRGARPSGLDSQFYQPAYQPQYQNYNMGNSMSISQYGQQPQINQQAGQFSTVGGNTLTPELARTLMQRSMTGSGVPTSEFQKFGGYDTVKALYDKSGGDYSGQGNPYPQQQFNPFTNQYQTPFSYQQPQYQQQQMQTPFSYQPPATQPAPQPQTPFSYQTSTGQPNKNYGLSYSAPMQLPQYVYDTIRDVNSYQSQPVQAYQSPRAMPATSSGPSQAIVGRSSQMRGTPNVMRRAEGGITSLLDNDE
jgi:hypothetical protein